MALELPSDAVAGNWIVRVSADGGFVAEAVVEVEGEAPPAPDLALTAADILFVPSSPEVNDTVIISANVTNLGPVTGTGWVRYYDGDPGSGGALIDEELVTVWDGASVNSSVSWTPITSREHIIYVRVEEVDPGDGDPSSNMASKAIEILPPSEEPLPDLHITEFVLSVTTVTEGKTVEVTVRVANNGSVAAGTFVVKFYLDGAVVHSYTVEGGMAPFGSADVVVDWRVEDKPGAHEFKVKVDANNQIEERDETNNEATLVVEILKEDEEEEDEGMPGFTLPEIALGALIGMVMLSFRSNRRRRRSSSPLEE